MRARLSYPAHPYPNYPPKRRSCDRHLRATPKPAPGTIAVTDFTTQEVGCWEEYSESFLGVTMDTARYLIVRVEVKVKNGTDEQSKPIWLFAEESSGLSRAPDSVLAWNRDGVPRRFEANLFSDAGGRVGPAKTKQFSYLLFFKGTKPAHYNIQVTDRGTTFWQDASDAEAEGNLVLTEATNLQSVVGKRCR